MILKFPENFFWGTATSAYQVEGGIKNDWSEIENINQEYDKYNAGIACDHYNRFEEDFDLAKSMNNNAHRFSIEWTRIEPEEDRFDQNEIEHYRKVILALKQRGLEPFVSLYHWTLPIWFAKQGGWLNPKAPEYFARFTEKVVLEYKDLVKFWITLNEPNVYAPNCYLQGVWTPFVKNIFKTIKVAKQLVKAHKFSFEVIKKIAPNSQAGLVTNNTWFRGIIKIFADYIYNHWFLNKIKNDYDFIGLNHYFTHSLFSAISHLKVRQNMTDNQLTDMGWRIVPEGIYRVLMDLKKYNKPIYVTENGLADAKDEKRAKFIVDHLRWIHKAIEDGIDVRGYFYWSLLDNFEWDKRFWPKFGLIETDYENGLKRIPRLSSKIYAEICKNNSINI